MGGDGDDVSVSFEVEGEEGICGPRFVDGERFEVVDKLFEIAY